MRNALKLPPSSPRQIHPLHRQFLFALEDVPGFSSWKPSFRASHDLWVDLACPEQRIAILLPDSHWSRPSRHSYRTRLNRLVAAGWRVFLFTVADLRRSFADCLSLVRCSCTGLHHAS